MAEKFQEKRLAKMEEMERLKAELSQMEDGTQDSIPPDEEEEVQKPKTERSQKQKDAFKRASEKRLENAKARKTERENAAVETNKEIEKKLIDKAIKLKKKQIKRVQVLEELSDEEEPVPTPLKRKEPPPKIVVPIKKLSFV